MRIILPVMVCQTFLYYITNPLVELRICGNALRERLRRTVEFVGQQFDDLSVSKWSEHAEDKIDNEPGYMRDVGIHYLQDCAFRPGSPICARRARSL